MASVDHWTLTEFRPRGKSEVWYFRKNLAPDLPVGDPRYGFLAYLTIAFEGIAENLRPSPDDYDLLVQIETQGLLPILAGNLAVHVGAVLKPGIRDLLFYTRDPAAFEAFASSLRASYPQFDIGTDVVEDPKWAQYGDLP
jgi:uncharacterized protein DUF695